MRWGCHLVKQLGRVQEFGRERGGRIRNEREWLAGRLRWLSSEVRKRLGPSGGNSQVPNFGMVS